MKRLSTLLLGLFLLAASQWGFHPPHAATASPAKVKIMLVGSHNLPYDMMRNQRQKEAEVLVQGLSQFRPHKIVVNVPFRSPWEEAMNQKYQAFLAGTHALNRSEEEQIGFRLAKRMGLERLEGIDLFGGFNLAEHLRVLAASGETVQAQELLQKGRGIEQAKLLHGNSHSLADFYTYLNQPENLAYEHSLYIRELSRLKGEDRQGGADLLTNWYGYHMQLFSNLTQIADQAGERIMLIVDSKYIPILKQLIEADPQLTYVNPLPFLLVN
ncbi:MAG: DUF5694 domain-containing protein [Bacteroidota bacterium]